LFSKITLLFLVTTLSMKTVWAFSSARSDIAAYAPRFENDSHLWGSCHIECFPSGKGEGGRFA
jgi:hypothetical protein